MENEKKNSISQISNTPKLKKKFQLENKSKRNSIRMNKMEVINLIEKDIDKYPKSSGNFIIIYIN